MEPYKIKWKNLYIRTKKETIVNNESGTLERGTLTALLGTSGAGKTTLLDTLASRTKMIISGDVLINDKKRTIKSYKNVAYVEQCFHAYMHQTVLETLLFSAELKIKNEIGYLNKTIAFERVENTMKQLGIEACRHILLKNVSGGELKRVSIGCELVGNPLLIFLDEPTSGLDSFNALNIVKRLKNLGITILMTLHQPNFEMITYFNKIFIMSLGESVVMGNIHECTDFFEEKGYPVPKNVNPCDYFLDLISIDTTSKESIDESTERINKFKKAWRDRKKNPMNFNGANYNAENHSEDDILATQESLIKGKFLQKDYIFYSESAKDLHLKFIEQNKSPDVKNKKIDQNFSNPEYQNEEECNTFPQPHRKKAKKVSFKIDFDELNRCKDDLYNKKDIDDEDDKINIKGLLKYFNPVYLFSIIINSSFPILLRRYYRETTRDIPGLVSKIAQRIIFTLLLGLSYLQIGYSPEASKSRRGLISFVIINSLFGTAGPIFNLFPQEKMIIYRERKSGLYNGISVYFACLLSNFILLCPITLMYIAAIYWMIGLNPNVGRFFIYLLINASLVFFSIGFGLTIGTLCPNTQTSQIVGTTVLIFFIIFGGNFNNPSTIPSWLRWLTWISPMNYAYKASMQNQFKGVTRDGFRDILKTDGVDSPGLWANIFGLWGVTCVTLLIGSVFLHLKSRLILKTQKIHNMSY